MTHTVHPYAHRIGIIRDWRSRWFAADKKTFLKKKLRGMHIAEIEIERSQGELRVILHTARPGLVIGRSGENATKLRKELAQVVQKAAPNQVKNIKLDIMEIRQPETSAAVVGMMVVEGLEKRMPFRRILKTTVEKVMASRDVVGVRIVVSGRLGGADMSRTESIKRGRIPLQTFRANIDYAHQEAHLPYGVIGVKVWVYLGEQFGMAQAGNEPARGAAPARSTNRDRA